MGKKHMGVHNEHKSQLHNRIPAPTNSCMEDLPPLPIYTDIMGPGTCDFYTQREKTSGKMIPCSCTNDEEDMKDEDFLMTRGGRADVVSIETRLI